MSTPPPPTPPYTGHPEWNYFLKVAEEHGNGFPEHGRAESHKEFEDFLRGLARTPDFDSAHRFASIDFDNDCKILNVAPKAIGLTDTPDWTHCLNVRIDRIPTGTPEEDILDALQEFVREDGWASFGKTPAITYSALLGVKQEESAAIAPPAPTTDEKAEEKPAIELSEKERADIQAVWNLRAGCKPGTEHADPLNCSLYFYLLKNGESDFSRGRIQCKNSGYDAELFATDPELKRLFNMLRVHIPKNAAPGQCGRIGWDTGTRTLTIEHKIFLGIDETKIQRSSTFPALDPILARDFCSRSELAREGLALISKSGLASLKATGDVFYDRTVTTVKSADFDAVFPDEGQNRKAQIAVRSCVMALFSKDYMPTLEEWPNVSMNATVTFHPESGRIEAERVTCIRQYQDITLSSAAPLRQTEAPGIKV